MLQKVIVFTPKDPPPATLREALTACGCEMLLAPSEARLLESLDRFSPDCTVILSSPVMDPDAERVVQRIRSIDHSCPLVIMTSGISAEGAI